MANGVLQFAGAAVSAAPQLLFGQGREPAFDQIEPGSSGRGEVQVKAGWRSSQRLIAGVLCVP